DPAFEYRTYLSLISVVLAVVLGLRALLLRIGNVRAFAIAVALLALALGGLTFRRNYDYASIATLWQDTVTKQPDNARAWNSLGKGLGKENRLPLALAAFRQAAAIEPFNPKHYIDIGNTLGEQWRGVKKFQRGDEIEQAYAHAVELAPHDI